MNKYLFLYGGDNSYFFTSAPSFISAFFKFAEYIGASFSPICVAALRAMNAPSEVVELYSHFDADYEKINKVYEIKDVVYSEVEEQAECE